MEEKRAIRREGALFLCAWCTYSHKWRVCVIQHTATYHRTTETLFECDRCFYFTAIKKDFRKHQERRRPCVPRTRQAAVSEITGRRRKFEIRDNLLEIRVPRDPLAVHKCETCDKSFTRHYDLIRHVKNKKVPCVKSDQTLIREGGVYKCSWCIYTHERRSKVEQHIAQHHHTTEPLKKCEKCDYTTGIKSDFLKHLANKTPCTRRDPLALGKYSCDLCNYTTNKRWLFRGHLNRKTSCIPRFQEGEPATFICGHCPLRATSAKVLERHVLNKHTINPALKCEVCDKHFQSIQAKQAHKHEIKIEIKEEFPAASSLPSSVDV